MKLTKYAILNTITYGLALFGPVLISQLFHLGQQDYTMLLILFNIVCACLMIYYIPKLETPLDVEKKRAKVSKKRAIMEGFIGIAIVLAAQSISVYLELLLGKQPVGSENTQNIMELIQSNFGVLLLVSIAGPIMEELFFRRTLIGLIGNKFDFLIGALASSMLFFLAHGDGHFLIYFVMGCVLSLLYRSTGNIVTSMIAHCGLNTFVTVMQLLIVYFDKFIPQ